MLYKLIFLLFLFLPTQLSYTFESLALSVNGFRIDYLLPTLYLTDLIVLSIILLQFKKIRQFLSALKLKTQLVLVALIVFSAINISSSDIIISSLYKWIKICELALLFLSIRLVEKLNIYKHIIVPLSISLIVVNMLGVLEYINSGSINGVFYYLGERQLMFSDPNVAPYPYSTFSHSNSFAAYTLVTFLLIYPYISKFNKRYKYMLIFSSIFTLLATNSQNVYMASLGLLIIWIVRSKLEYLMVFVDFTSRSVTHRLELLEASILMIKSNILTGVGANNFTVNLVKYSNRYLNAWEIQPVHNIYLLLLSEFGVLGVLALLYFVFPVLTFNYPLLAIILTGLNDHYWVSQQQNMMLLTMVLVLPKIKVKN